MSAEEFRARLAAEACRCGHRRDQHRHGDCGVDLAAGPCLCEQFTRPN